MKSVLAIGDYNDRYGVIKIIYKLILFVKRKKNWRLSTIFFFGKNLRL